MTSEQVSSTTDVFNESRITDLDDSEPAHSATYVSWHTKIRSGVQCDRMKFFGGLNPRFWRPVIDAEEDTTLPRRTDDDEPTRPMTWPAMPSR